MPNFPNRCQRLKVNGTQCGSPALRRNRFCYFHKLHQEQRITLSTDRLRNDQARRSRNLTITLPVLEDANSIQVTLMQVMRLIISGQIAAKQTGLLLYALQTASSNLARTSFEPYRHDIVLDPKTVNQTALGSPIWEDEDFPDNQEEANDEAANPDDPRPNFTPRTPQEARNKAEMSRWSEAEADRLQALGKLQREAERRAELREDRIEAERQQAEEEAIEAVARQNASRSAAAVTPAGRAILPPQPPTQPPAKHPPAKATIGEVREKVNV